MQKFDEFLDEYLNEQDETVRSEYEEAKKELKDLKEDKIMKKIILDESILDIDKWLPQEAIDQIVEIILHLEEIENKKPSKKRR